VVTNDYNGSPRWSRSALSASFALNASWPSPVPARTRITPVDGESQLALRAKGARTDTAQDELILIVTIHHFE
jgi:hypothetical protein